MTTNRPSRHEATVYTGHTVVDGHGRRIGTVSDVIYDDTVADAEGGRRPSWLVVDPGRLRAAHYVPVAGSRRGGDGTIAIPWDRDRVRTATRAGHVHLLTREVRDELCEHYELGGSGG